MEVGSKVAQRFRLALPLYLCLLIVLALSGMVNQRLLANQLDLMNQKDELLAEIALARVAAASGDALGAVGLPAGARGRTKAHAESGGSPSGGVGAPAHGQLRASLAVRPGRHAHRATPEREGLTRPRGTKGGHHLAGPSTPLPHRHAEHGELVGDVAVGDHQLEPAPAEEVDDRGIARVLAHDECSAQECVDGLVAAALDNGGSDNVTVVLVRRA